MQAQAFCKEFETTLGPCALTWREGAIVGFELPQHRPGEALARALSRKPGLSAGEAPAWIAAVIERVRAHFAGSRDDFLDLPLSYDDAPVFHRAVYDAVRQIRPSQLRTYGEVAHAVGVPGGARAVGQAMGRNPLPLLVPCHRVVAAQGKPGGFTATGGLRTKERMLETEGALAGVRFPGSRVPSLRHVSNNA